MMRHIINSLMLILVCCSAGYTEEVPLLWGAKVSPYVRKAMVALEYKGMDYKLKEILPAKLLFALNQQVPPSFAKASPLGKIPAFQQGEFSIADSSVIVAYLEKVHPEQPLFPHQAEEYAQALWLEEYADSVMSEVINGKIFFELFVKPNELKRAPDSALVKSAIQEELPIILDYLEQILAANECESGYLVGASLSVADLAVANHFVSLKLSKVHFDQIKWPRLSAYLDRVFAVPAFKKVVGDLIQ